MTASDAAIAPASQVPGGNAVHNRAIVNGVLWQGTLRWLSQLLSWSATVVIARRLSPEDYGIAGSATVFVGLLTIVTEGGLGRAIVARREKNPDLIAQAHGASMLLGAALAALMVLAAYPVGRFYGEPRIAPMVAVLSLVMVMSGMTAIPTAMLQQRLEYRRLATVDFAKAIAQAAVVMLGAALGFGAWSLAFGLLAGHATVVLLIRRYVAIGSAWPHRAALLPTGQYAQSLVTGSLAWYLYSNADFAVVGRVAGLTALGFYQFGWNLAQLPGEKLGNVLQNVVGPFFGSIGDDIASLRHYFLLLSELLVSIMLPVLVGFALVAPTAVPLVFGDKWLPAVPLMQTLVAAAAVSSLSTLSHHVLSATGNASVSTKVSVAAAVVLPVAFFVAGRMGGAFGVASVWLVAQPVLITVTLINVRRAIDLPVWSYLRNLAAPAVSAAVMAGAVLAVGAQLELGSRVATLAVLSVGGAIVYTGTYVALFRHRIGAMLAVWKHRA